jgi:tRNA(Ile)-lysidine synthase
MLNVVSDTIKKYNMIEQGESLLCCLSGGADSVALLLCSKRLGLNVRACHVNHMLRGEESMRDERFCVELCDRLEIPLTVKRVDAKAYAEKCGMSLEEGARQLRYRIFDECGCDKIATAHTLSDCLETTVFHLARGTGLTGLAAIPPVRGNIVRPLINCRREEITDFLKSQGQDWVTDSSNLTDDYSRNKIRHNIIPQMANINRSLEKTYLGTLENLREDSALLKRLADELYEKAETDSGFDCRILLSADCALSGRVYRRILDESNAECSRERISALRTLCESEKGGKITLHSGLYACSDGEFFRIVRERPPLADFEIAAVIGEVYSVDGKNILLEICKKSDKNVNVHKKITNIAADYGKIKGEVVIRNRRSGDRIKFAGKGFTTSVKKLFQQSVNRDERSRRIMLADRDGLFYIEGFGFAERVKPDSDTKTVLICKIS